MYRVTRYVFRNRKTLALAGGETTSEVGGSGGGAAPAVTDLLILTILVMNETERSPIRGRGGRPPKSDRAANCVMVRFTDRQYAEFLSMFERSGVPSKARFILARVFDEPLRVVKTDSSALEFVAKLTSLYGQFRAVGVNYNQTVKQLHTTFGDKKALSMLYKLEQETIDLVNIGKETLALCEEFRRECLPQQP